MSVHATYFNIIGYDLTSYKSQIIPEDWFWNDGENYVNNQTKGNIQFFNDPMSGEHLYFGYILSCIEEYGDTSVTKISLSEFLINNNKIQKALINTGLNISDEILELVPEFISFVEYY